MTEHAFMFETRNAHFDGLLKTNGLKWLGQNTNHFPPHPDVVEAMHETIRREEFHAYAPPYGLEALRAGVVADLGPEMEAVGHRAIITDGAVAALYHICHTLLGPGDELLTTDPTWNWPVNFARSVGASVRQIPIFGDEFGYRLAPQRLADAIGSNTRIVYFVDPNNPLGTAATPDEIAAIAEIVRAAGCYLVHDCTYRHFAHSHSLAAPLAPERTLTTYSFSKWLGIAGLRLGAVVADPSLLEKLADAPPNNLGSSILAERAALAGLAVKDVWFGDVLARTRRNLDRVEEAATAIDGLRVPVSPSNGNFLIIDVTGAGITPEALCQAAREHGIMIRQGSYHTPTFGDSFVKVSVSVPEDWVDSFCDLLPDLVERARGMNEAPALF